MHSQHSFKRKCVKYLSRLMLGSVLFLVLYVISLGPIVAIFHRSWLSSPLNYKTHPDNALIERIYSPIYDFNVPYGCQLSFEQAPPWKQQQLLWLNQYVSFCRELKYILSRGDERSLRGQHRRSQIQSSGAIQETRYYVSSLTPVLYRITL